MDYGGYEAYERLMVPRITYVADEAGRLSTAVSIPFHLPPSNPENVAMMVKELKAELQNDYSLD